MACYSPHPYPTHFPTPMGYIEIARPPPEDMLPGFEWFDAHARSRVLMLTQDYDEFVQDWVSRWDACGGPRVRSL